MSLVKYRLRDVASDFGMAPKEIAEVISKFFEKPKSNTQVLTEEELNVVFDYVTRTHQIQSLEQVFAVKPKEQPKAEAPKAPEAPKAAPQQPRQQNGGSRATVPRVRTTISSPGRIIISPGSRITTTLPLPSRPSRSASVSAAWWILPLSR